MSLLSSVGAWSFNPLVEAFPATVLPNIAYWNVSNGTWEYQVQVSWPLNWTSRDVDSSVETLYVLDGNALAHTATEAFRKRRPVEFGQPDTIVVSIGYPKLQPDSPYSDGRYYDYQMPVCATCPPQQDAPGVPSGADAFITFLDNVLRPWIHGYFPNVDFHRDGIYGHSFGGLFVLYALLTNPDLFDVYLSASPYLIWNKEYIFSKDSPLYKAVKPKKTKPAFQLSYGALEQAPKKRRTETQAAFETRKAFLSSLKTADLSNKLFNEIKKSPNLRHTELHTYPFSYHAALGGNALADGIDYFLDWP
ncbi:siderophore esteras-like protein IroE-like protein [Aaosphaeria arxii CBS 175.79]|uniref:Siderophore esteras-like protein IroE-like protein n=1 Tax=Aaosphaeria arxii CBS 175.79 TaxID=1450172 RepID=A0A6A5XN12_9PLEO|nr:siderophore esteras-like protein IroE-like protein [Aaosphaeria arxii CBS 175.79]KAF2014201.1 siderophore esteras-like protein IroE-like protein [Aaosphaeria arxii CBS 175.79]